MEQTSKDQAQYEKMTKTPVSKLIISLAIPTTVSMLVSSIYNMADTFFVSKLGTSATGAVGIVFSLMAIVQAVGFTLGMGAGSTISRLLGQQKQKQANIIGSTAFFSAIGFGLLLTIFGLAFVDGLMHLLGATPTILPYARGYAQYILFGAPVMCASFVLNNILRSEGKAALSMIGLTLGGVLNMVLDPIFIFTLGLGISGAAIATLISQCVSFAILLYCFLAGKSITKLSVKHIARTVGPYVQIIKIGFPSLCRQGLASIATVALNVNAAVYGDAAVAAMSIVGRVFMFIQSVMLGIGQGFQPVSGYNYGARKYDRVRQAYWFTVKAGFILMTSLCVLGFLFAPQVVALFRKDDLDVIQIGALAFRAQCVALPLMSLSMPTNMLMQSTGKSMEATILACSRQGIFFLPLILVLPQMFGLLGVQLAQPLADALTLAISAVFLVRFMRKLKVEEQEAKAQEAQQSHEIDAEPVKEI